MALPLEVGPLRATSYPRILVPATTMLGRTSLTNCHMALFHGKNNQFLSRTWHLSAILSTIFHSCFLNLWTNGSFKHITTIAVQNKSYRLDVLHWKAQGKPENPISLSVCIVLSCMVISWFPFQSQDRLECLVALILGTTGAYLKAPPLKEITLASEMRKRCARAYSLFVLYIL